MGRVRLGAAVAALALGSACGWAATPSAGPPMTEADAPAPPAVLTQRPSGVGTAMAAGTPVTLRIIPPEQYAGEPFHTAVEVSGPTAIRSVKLDLGNGAVVDVDPAPAWACPSGPRLVMAAPPALRYATPGRYTVTAMVTVVPCVYLPGPDGVIMPWVASGPEQVVQARVDVDQRAQAPPQP